MGTITRFEEIHAWQKARELVREIYKSSNTSLSNKDYGLKDQIRRAAVSSISNIAEGYGRKSDRDFAHFLDIARSSSLEVQSILYVALDLEYIQEKEFNKLYNMANKCISMIAGFSSYLRQN
jgi:four helix bundle protein